MIWTLCPACFICRLLPWCLFSDQLNTEGRLFSHRVILPKLDSSALMRSPGGNTKVWTWYVKTLCEQCHLYRGHHGVVPTNKNKSLNGATWTKLFFSHATWQQTMGLCWASERASEGAGKGSADQLPQALMQASVCVINHSGTLGRHNTSDFPSLIPPSSPSSSPLGIWTQSLWVPRLPLDTVTARERERQIL